MKPTIAMNLVPLLLFGGLSLAGDVVDVKVTAAVRQYCRIVRFPQVWNITAVLPRGDALFYHYEDDYEFRAIGPIGSRFLVAGFTVVGKTNYYTINKYEVDLSDPVAPILAAAEESWRSARAVPISSEYLSGPRPGYPNQDPEFLGKRYPKSGERLGYDCGLPSPDHRVFVLHSWT